MKINIADTEQLSEYELLLSLEFISDIGTINLQDLVVYTSSSPNNHKGYKVKLLNSDYDVECSSIDNLLKVNIINFLLEEGIISESSIHYC